MRHKLYYFQPLPDEKSNKSEIKKNQIKLKKMMQHDPNRTHYFKKICTQINSMHK